MRTSGADVLGKLAHRPGLEDLRKRQREVLDQLDEPFDPEDRRSVVKWKYGVIEGSLGRIPEGLRHIFADPFLAAMLEPFFFDDGDAGREFRLELQELLAVAFAYPLEDSSRISVEVIPARGMGHGEVHVGDAEMQLVG